MLHFRRQLAYKVCRILFTTNDSRILVITTVHLHTMCGVHPSFTSGVTLLIKHVFRVWSLLMFVLQRKQCFCSHYSRCTSIVQNSQKRYFCSNSRFRKFIGFFPMLTTSDLWTPSTSDFLMYIPTRKFNQNKFFIYHVYKVFKLWLLLTFKFHKLKQFFFCTFQVDLNTMYEEQPSCTFWGNNIQAGSHLHSMHNTGY